MSTGEANSTPRWEAIADEFLVQTPAEVAFSSPRTTLSSIADPIAFMRRLNPKRAAEMQQRRDNLVKQRELSAIDPRVRDFRMGATAATPEASADPRQSARRQARRIISMVNDANNGWPELAKTNPELAAEFRAEHQAIIDCRRRAASDPDILDMRLD